MGIGGPSEGWEKLRNQEKSPTSSIPLSAQGWSALLSGPHNLCKASDGGPRVTAAGQGRGHLYSETITGSRAG